MEDSGSPGWSPRKPSGYSFSSDRRDVMHEERQADGGDVTALLRRYGAGELDCLGEAVAMVYGELHRIAARHLRRASGGPQLEATVLVNEAFEKLVRGKTQRLQDRRHFFAIASRAMRQVVVDDFRARATAKRGADAVFVTLTSSQVHGPDDPERWVAVHEALEQLAEHNPDLVEVLDMACFGGLSNEEIAELTRCTLRTVQRKLKRAQVWLAHFMVEG